MSSATVLRLPVAVLAAAALACGGGEGTTDDENRDLSLAPAESIAVMNDRPVEAPAPSQQPQAAAPKPASRPSAPAPAPAPKTLAAGTVVSLTANDSISSKTNAVGDPIVATLVAPLVDENGEVVIPAGATFHGVVTELKHAANPQDSGTLVLAFNRVSVDGKSYLLDASSDSLSTERRGQGVTTGDAVKVGVGAAAGAVLGGIISKDATGAVVGGVVGAATGAGVAVVTKDADIVLPAGGAIRIILNAEMVLDPVS